MSAHRDLIPVPRLAVLSSGAHGVLRGSLSPDALTTICDGPEFFLAPPFELTAWLLELQLMERPVVNLLLPAPGRIAGLVGPPPAVTAALTAGQALVTADGSTAQHTLTAHRQDPHHRTLVVERWTAPEGRRIPPQRIDGARERLFHTLQSAVRTAERLDLIPDEPVPPALMPAEWMLMEPHAGLSDSLAHVARIAGRTLLQAQQLLADPDLSGAHRTVLSELSDASRDALSAALSATPH